MPVDYYSTPLQPLYFDAVTRQDDNKNYIAQRLGFENYQQCLTYPKFIELETVRACNARCTFCAIDDWSTEKVKDLTLPDALFEKFITEISDFTDRIDTVCLCRDGEPTLDKKLAERIKKLKNIGIKRISISTNAQILTSDLSQALLHAGIDDMMFSIDGATKAVFENIRKNLKFDKVVSNTLEFIRLRNAIRPSTRIRVRMVVTEDNRHEVNDFFSFWNQQVTSDDLVQAKELHNWGNQLAKESLDNINKFSDLPCIAPFNMFTIHLNGNVVMCGHDFSDRHVVGNIKESTIQQIWQDKAINRIRHLHLAGQRNKIDMCRGCDIWDRNCIS